MKKAYRILPLIMSLFCITAAAKAQELTVQVETTDKKGQLYTLRVYQKGVELEAATDQDIVAFDDGEAIEDGKVSFVLDFGYPSGIYQYVVKSFSADFETIGEVAFTNEQEYQNAISALITASKAENAGESTKKVFDEYKDVFLIDADFDLYDDVTALATQRTYEKIANHITQNITIEEIKKVYRQEMMLGAMETAQPALIVKMNTEYGEDLGLKNDQVNQYYQKLNAAAKEAAAEKAKGKYESLEEYALAHAQAVAIESMNHVSSWTELRTIINDLNGVAKLDFPANLGSSKEASVLNRLSEKIPFASVSEFQTAVNQLVNSTTTGGGDTGGGGGGSSSGGAKKDTSSSKSSYIVPSNPTDTTPSEPEKYFNDLSDVAWAEKAINKLASMNIVSGRGDKTFAPNDYIKREEFVKMIVDAFQITGEDINTFSDISGDEWFAPYVVRASASGVTKGYEDGSFGVGKNITREDACSMIARAVGLDQECEIELEFSDCDDISGYSVNAIKNLVKIGAVNGADGKILPKNNITRAETAVIISTVLEVIEQ